MGKYNSMDERVKSQKRDKYLVWGSLIFVNALVLAPLGIYKAVEMYNHADNPGKVERVKESDLKIKIEKY